MTKQCWGCSHALIVINEVIMLMYVGLFIVLLYFILFCFPFLQLLQHYWYCLTFLLNKNTTTKNNLSTGFDGFILFLMFNQLVCIIWSKLKRACMKYCRETWLFINNNMEVDWNSWRWWNKYSTIRVLLYAPQCQVAQKIVYAYHFDELT